MEHLNFLKNRYSTPILEHPAPTAEELSLVWQAATRAPDHARLKPLRLQIWQGNALLRLGNLFAQSARAQTPDITEEALQRYRNIPLRAPMVAIVSASIQEHPKVPEIEQVISAGCGAYAMILALNDLGYGCMWRTGVFAYYPQVKSAIGLDPADHIVGFIYIGSKTTAKIKKGEEPLFAERVTFIDE